MPVPRLLVLDAGEELAAQVERATASLRPRPEVVGCEGFESFDRLLAERGPFDLLIAGPTVVTGDGLAELRRRRAQMAETSLVLAFARWRSSILRETVRTGALDILRLPVTDGAIADVVEQALETRGERHAGTTERRGAQRREGAVIAVVSATGGCGKTFFSTNLAYYLQSRMGKQTCLIDLDLQFGELSTALRLRPRYTIVDLLSGGDGDGDDLGGRLGEHLARHDTGIQVLAAPEEPADADAVDTTDVARVIEAARARFDYVIVDTPATLSEAVLVALEHAGQVFALATLDLPSVRNLGVLLNTFSQLKIPSKRVHLVLNKVERNVGIDIPQVTKYFPQGFSIVVPYGREVNRSLNMGMPMLAFAPRSEVARVLSVGFASALAPDPEAEGPEPPRRRLVDLLRKRPA
jgi:pilus assembly protein CpaE